MQACPVPFKAWQALWIQIVQHVVDMRLALPPMLVATDCVALLENAIRSGSRRQLGFPFLI